MTNQKKVEEIMEVAFDVLNDWEIDFMKSIKDDGPNFDWMLTVKQQSVLDKIYGKVCESEY